MKTESSRDESESNRDETESRRVFFASCWVIDNKVGVTCRLQQVLLDRSERLPSFAFVGIPGLDDGPAKPAAKTAGDFVSDDDEMVDE